MKLFTQIITVSLFLLPYFSLPAQSPCINVAGEWSSPCPPIADQMSTSASVSGNDVQFNLLDPTFGLDEPAGDDRYKAFWIFGDGTFKYFEEGGDKAADLLSHTPMHDYAKTTRYRAMAVLMEKKSNTTPPQGPKRSISVTSNPTVTDWVPQITDPGRSMDIFPSAMNRPHYLTAFAVSARKEDTGISGIFFFFNSLGTGGGFASGDLHDAMDSWALLPDYFSVSGITIRSTQTDLPTMNTFVGPFLNLRNHYKNFIFVPVSLPSGGVGGTMNNIPTNFSELRIFPVLNTIWQDSWVNNTLPLPTGKYMAIAVGPNPHDGQNQPSYWQNLVNSTQSEISNTIDATTLRITEPGSPQSLFVRGIATTEVNMTGAIDPNELEITRICPLGNDQYRVTFRMKVCNEGYLEAMNFPIFLKDFTDGNLLSEPVFIGPGTAPTPADANPNNDGDWDYTWNITLNGVPKPVKGDREPEPGSTCQEIFFTTTTTWAGVQQLMEGRALQLCVFFNMAPVDCAFNFPLTVDNPALIQTEGYNAADCNRDTGETTPPNDTDCDCCKPQYTTVIILQVIILILIVLIIWMILKKQFPEFFRWLGGSGKQQ